MMVILVLSFVAVVSFLCCLGVQARGAIMVASSPEILTRIAKVLTAASPDKGNTIA